MGGNNSASDVVIGYKYYVGIHMILCHGPVDKLLRIRVEGKDAWLSTSKGGPVTINNYQLFGGESREGGLVGTLDFEPGGPTQVQNTYLLEKIGNLISAYRGTVGMVLRQFYIGMNPYLKPWAFTLSRIHTRKDGQPQWFDSKSEIRVGGFANKRQCIFLGIDTKVSGPTLTYIRNEMYAVIDAIQEMDKQTPAGVDVGICFYARNAYADAVTYTWRTATDADYAAMKAVIGSGDASIYDAKYSIGMGRASQWAVDAMFLYATAEHPQEPFRTTIIMVTAGNATDAGTAAINNEPLIQRTGVYAPPFDVDVFFFNIDNADIAPEQTLDNTPHDSVPNILSSEPGALSKAIRFATFGSVSSMNPAHIIRECLTDSKWGMGYAETDIDDFSFAYAASILYEEQFGLSIVWDTESTIEEFIGMICRHIDAAIYVDRRTGKFFLKLIREDYVESSLIVLNENNIVSIADFARPSFGELTNSVTVTYNSSETDGNATITVHDIALAQQQGININVAVTYEAVQDAITASKLAQRDLRVLSTPIISCTIITNTIAENLNIGSVFKLTWADYDIQDVVMRVTTIAFGDGKNNRIRITAVQDIFGFPDTAYITPEPPPWVDPISPPAPISRRTVTEMPYLQMVQTWGQDSANIILAENPQAGYAIGAGSISSSGALSMRMYVYDGSADYTDVAGIQFCPSAMLTADIDRMVNSFEVSGILDAANIVLGSWFQLGTELMSVEAITSNIITVKRAVLDTVPVLHVAGEFLIFWDLLHNFAPTQYSQYDAIGVKLLSVTGSAILPVEIAPEDILTFNARAIRPYPPGNVQINGAYFPTATLTTAVVTWASRNRLQQTGGTLIGFTEGNVTPEDGTTYTVILKNAGGTVVYTATDITVLTHTLTSAILGTTTPVSTIELFSVREGFESNRHIIPIAVAAAYGDNLEFIMDNFATPPSGDGINFIVS